MIYIYIRGNKNSIKSSHFISLSISRALVTFSILDDYLKSAKLCNVWQFYYDFDLIIYFD